MSERLKAEEALETDTFFWSVFGFVCLEFLAFYAAVWVLL